MDAKEYKGHWITRLFPSGYYQYYSHKQGRFLSFDSLSDCKESIRSEF